MFTHYLIARIKDAGNFNEIDMILHVSDYNCEIKINLRKIIKM